MRLSQQTTNTVWGRSGGRCYLDRRQELSRSDSGTLPIGEVAHIVGEKITGPRGDADMPLEQRSSVANLLLLCPNHHTEIDKHPDIWTTERLKQIKCEHEDWVRRTLDWQVTPLKYFNDALPGVVIDFEMAHSSEPDTPRFTFSVRNTSPDTLVVHSIDAEVLSLAVRPSIASREFRLANSMLIARTPVNFDFSAATEGVHISPAHIFDEHGLADKSYFDPLEAAVQLAAGESEHFSARVVPGSYAKGIFRLVATYWEYPGRHYTAYSSSVGFFSVPDRDGVFSYAEPSGDSAESRLLGFDDLVLRAKSSASVGRPIWTGDPSDSAQLFQRAIGGLGHARSRVVIEEWLTSDSPELHMAALEAIDGSADSDWKCAMAERALSHASEVVRASAISVVGHLEHSEAFETLARKALADPSPLVRTRALDRLQYVSTPTLDQAKRGLLNDLVPDVARLASESLKKRGAPRELLDAADAAGVGDLYRHVLLALETIFSRRNTRSAVTFYAPTGSASPRAVLSIVPGESCAEQGVRYRAYLQRLSRTVGAPESDLRNALPPNAEPWSYTSTPDPEYSGCTGYLKDAHDIDRFVAFVKARRKP